MRIDILTLFPAMFEGPLTESILGRAREQKIIDVHLHDLRQFGIGAYKQIDDKPYGGGAGMVMRVDVLANAIQEVVDGHTGKGQDEKDGKDGKDRKDKKRKTALKKDAVHRILLSASGTRLTQEKVEELAKKKHLLFVCGHYEGVDHRIVEGGWIDEEISIGDYVLTGGELPAMVVIDAVARQLPGTLGKEVSAHEESFSKKLDRKREYPHYTRPEIFEGLGVPDVLLSGNHAEIEKWRRARVR